MKLGIRPLVWSIFALGTAFGCGRSIIADQMPCDQPDVTAPTGFDAGDASDARREAETAPSDEVESGVLPINPNAVCPIVGDGDNQLLIGGATCNGCVKTNCCDVLTACAAGSPDGGVMTADGGVTDCLNRLACLYDEGCAIDPDAGGCNAMCAARFSSATNALATPAIECMFGPQLGKPSKTGNCSIRADGGLLCAPL